MRTVYLEKSEIHDKFVDHNVYCAWNGFTLLGYKCVPFTYKQMEHLDLDKDSIVVGYIRTVTKAFEYLGVPRPIEVSIPPELMKYAGRKVWESTLGDIRKDDLEVFIKPLEGHKIFTGHVRSNNTANLMQTAMLPNDTKVLCSEVVDFITEYRGFVLNGKLIGLKNYTGDFTKMVDATRIKKAIKDYVSAPVAYSIDFGLTSGDQNLLVEVNDAFALGSYGLNHIDYANMIQVRWDEIVGNDGT
jgi:hypothetical protein